MYFFRLLTFSYIYAFIYIFINLFTCLFTDIFIHHLLCELTHTAHSNLMAAQKTPPPCHSVTYPRSMNDLRSYANEVDTSHYDIHNMNNPWNPHDAPWNQDISRQRPMVGVWRVAGLCSPIESWRPLASSCSGLPRITVSLTGSRWRRCESVLLSFYVRLLVLMSPFIFRLLFGHRFGIHAGNVRAVLLFDFQTYVFLIK